jgi:hypothetical protein
MGWEPGYCSRDRDVVARAGISCAAGIETEERVGDNRDDLHRNGMLAKSNVVDNKKWDGPGWVLRVFAQMIT